MSDEIVVGHIACVEFYGLTVFVSDNFSSFVLLIGIDSESVEKISVDRVVGIDAQKHFVFVFRESAALAYKIIRAHGDFFVGGKFLPILCLKSVFAENSGCDCRCSQRSGLLRNILVCNVAVGIKSFSDKIVAQTV